jgi:hypothetical protein
VEFEQLLNNEPLDLDYEKIDGEERYRSVGITDGGRFLLAVWTVAPAGSARSPRFRPAR